MESILTTKHITAMNAKHNDPRKLINWSELSRMIIRGDRNGIRINKVPRKHQPMVEHLIIYIESWMHEYSLDEYGPDQDLKISKK
jgi:hypothetical protein